jgi:hypothetical protein
MQQRPPKLTPFPKPLRCRSRQQLQHRHQLLLLLLLTVQFTQCCCYSFCQGSSSLRRQQLPAVAQYRCQVMHWQYNLSTQGGAVQLPHSPEAPQDVHHRRQQLLQRLLPFELQPYPRLLKPYPPEILSPHHVQRRG